VFALRALLRDHDPDLVEGDEPMPSIATGLAARGRSAVIVYRRHHAGGRRRLLMASWLAAHLADRTFVSCEAMRRQAAADDRLPLRRIDVTSSGAPEPAAPTADHVDAARRSLGIDGEARVVVCVSRLRREKGLDILIASVAHLADIRNLHVVIVGGGPEAAVLRTVADRCAVPVHFVGHQPDIGHWLAMGDVVAIPSRRESFGRVTLEAMAMGRPIVASAVGGLTEAIVDGESGCLVPPQQPAALAQALRALIVDPLLARRLGEAARHRYRSRYTMDHMATSWRQGWERALLGRPTS